MRIGKFELAEPQPEIRSPHVIASLTPWVDAGSVGSLTIERLERFMDAQDVGKLAVPGTYFDFTRYRPVMYYEDGQRKMKIPNADLRWAKGSGDHDFIFFHMLEPHAFAEEYLDATVEVLQYLNVKRFCRIGAMSIIGGCSKVVQVIPAYMMADGNPAATRALNKEGLKRNDVSEETQTALKQAHRILFRENLTFTKGVEKARAEIPASDEIEHLLTFIETSQRGIAR